MANEVAWAALINRICSESDEVEGAARRWDSQPELLAALDNIAQWQREKCELADAEILFALLDIKVGIALAAIAKARGARR